MCLPNLDVDRDSHKKLICEITLLLCWSTASSLGQNATDSQTATGRHIQNVNHSNSEKRDEIKDILLVSTALRQKIDNSLPGSSPATRPLLCCNYSQHFCALNGQELNFSRHSVLETQESHKCQHKATAAISSPNQWTLLQRRRWCFPSVHWAPELEAGPQRGADSTRGQERQAERPLEKHLLQLLMKISFPPAQSTILHILFTSNYLWASIWLLVPGNDLSTKWVTLF